MLDKLEKDLNHYEELLEKNKVPELDKDIKEIIFNIRIEIIMIINIYKKICETIIQ